MEDPAAFTRLACALQGLVGANQGMVARAQAATWEAMREVAPGLPEVFAAFRRFPGAARLALQVRPPPPAPPVAAFADSADGWVRRRGNRRGKILGIFVFFFRRTDADGIRRRTLPPRRTPPPSRHDDGDDDDDGNAARAAQLAGHVVDAHVVHLAPGDAAALVRVCLRLVALYRDHHLGRVANEVRRNSRPRSIPGAGLPEGAGD